MAARLNTQQIANLVEIRDEFLAKRRGSSLSDNAFSPTRESRFPFAVPGYNARYARRIGDPESRNSKKYSFMIRGFVAVECGS